MRNYTASSLVIPGTLNCPQFKIAGNELNLVKNYLLDYQLYNFIPRS